MRQARLYISWNNHDGIKAKTTRRFVPTEWKTSIQTERERESSVTKCSVITSGRDEFARNIIYHTPDTPVLGLGFRRNLNIFPAFFSIVLNFIMSMLTRETE